MRRRASLHNLGCKVNAYETEAMEQLLRDGGYEIVPFGEETEVCIINTCSVTNVADKKSRQMLHRARAKNPKAVIVAAGCYVQAAENELKEDLAVDILIGNNRKKDLLEILEEYFQSQGRTDTFVVDISRAKEYEDLHIRQVSGHTRALIKIQDGCNQFCSYCIIPYTRGRVRSRNAEEILEEARRLASQGFKELVLTGIHLSSYGLDSRSGEEEEDFIAAGGGSLLNLIRLLHEVEGVERIRLGSLEPRIVTRKFAMDLAALPKVCPHFHLSLQSGSAETLKRMNRHYTPREYRESCGYLREAFEHPAITTDVIVGFPGETEEEFAQTKEFLEQIRLYEMHVFKYSRRKGTRAASMPNQTEEKVKAERSEQLLALEKMMSEEYRAWFTGKEVEVLLEEEVLIQGSPYWVGYSREYVKQAVSLERLKQAELPEQQKQAKMSERQKQVKMSEQQKQVKMSEQQKQVKMSGQLTQVPPSDGLTQAAGQEDDFSGRVIKGRMKGFLTSEIMEFIPF